jgi:pre-rRNA-processing protein RIX1
MSASVPTDLRVICRKLASASAADLSRSLPSLVNHVLRCKQALSAPQDTKAKGESSDCAFLVQKLKKSITTLLESRDKNERFTAIALVKAAVDVGGWEVLRGSAPWVRGLIAIVKVGNTKLSNRSTEVSKLTMSRKVIVLRPRSLLLSP